MSPPKPTPTPVLLQWQSPRSSHHVCFSCRKQFRKPVTVRGQRLASGKSEARYGHFDVSVLYPCPQCGQTMTHMGKNFRAPALDDLEGWEIARQLATAGFRHKYRTGQEYPTRLRDVDAFLKRHVPRSDGEKLLEKWQ